MKLAYLSDSRIPSREANAVHVMKMCQAFAGLGHAVTLVAPDIAGTESGVADPFAFYGVKPSFDLRKISHPKIRGASWLYGWRAGRQALRDGGAYGRSLAACAVASVSGVPTRWDAHMPTFLHLARDRWLFRRMVAGSGFRGMTTNCDALRREILRHFPELDGRIRPLHNGADPIPATLPPADIGGQNRLQAGYVGQLYPGKGLEILTALAARAPWADFHIVGGNTDTIDALKREARESSNIQVHGFVPPAETERYLIAFDVLLAPYQREVITAGGTETGAWMSPLKLFAYMSAGKPILCSDLPVLHEIIADGRNGIFVPPDHADAWATALKRLADNPGERRRLGESARADFLAGHTWRFRAEQAIEGLLP